MKTTWGCVSLACAALAATAVADDLVVSSFHTGRVLRYDEAGAFIGELAVGGNLLFAGGIVYGPDGHLLVCDQGRGEVQKYDGATGQFISVFIPSGAGGLDTAQCMLIGPDNRLYASNTRSMADVLRFNAATGAFIDVFATSPTFSQGGDMVVRGNSLYVCSEASHEVLRFNASTGAFQGVFCSSGLFFPRGLDFGPDGHLYVASAFGNEIRKYHGQTGADLGAFITTNLSIPADIDFGPDGRLYVCDSSGDRIARFDGLTGQYIDEFATGNGMDGPHQMFFVPESCYPDCDTSTGRGMLDIFDFLCFQNRYTQSEPYACDCDLSTGNGVCDIFDFLCFQNEFSAGCP
jgi:DNA-binding beta-propeller fold protein YncE